MKLVLSPKDAAAALGVSTRTLDRWRVEGLGPLFCKLGKRVAYTECDLQRFVADSRRQSTSETHAA